MVPQTPEISRSRQTLPCQGERDRRRRWRGKVADLHRRVGIAGLCRGRAMLAPAARNVSAATHPRRGGHWPSAVKPPKMNTPMQIRTRWGVAGLHRRVGIIGLCRRRARLAPTARNVSAATHPRRGGRWPSAVTPPKMNTPVQIRTRWGIADLHRRVVIVGLCRRRAMLAPTGVRGRGLSFDRTCAVTGRSGPGIRRGSGRRLRCAAF